MDMHLGLFSNAVLQRTTANDSDATFQGSTKAVGPVIATVTRDGKPLRGFANKVVGKASAGQFKGRLQGLPVGGPYRIDLRIDAGKNYPADKTSINNVLVGDIWVLGGQSNMQGVGLVADAPKPNPNVRAFYMDDSWRKAKEPLHFLNTAVDPVHNGGVRTPEPANPVAGVGPGLAFGLDMFNATGVPQGLIACAHGGTTMTQWAPAHPDDHGQSLYGATVRRVRKIGGRIAGIVWYQGESDANPDAAPHYTQRMVELVAAMRRDLGNAKAPIAIVQIGRVIRYDTPWPDWNRIQEQQRRLPESIARATVVPAIDLSLDDSIHISGTDQNRLGRRLAQAMRTLLAPRSKAKGKAMPAPIAIRKVSVQPDPIRMDHAIVTVEFDNVVGKLHADGARPMGFVLKDGDKKGTLYRTHLLGDTAQLHVLRPFAAAQSFDVMYGEGPDPACNIVDEADRSLPMFGPLPVTGPRALTDYVGKLRVAGPLDVKGGSKSLPALKNLNALQTRDFASTFGDIHFDYPAIDAADPVTYFATSFACSEPMDLSVLLGYDGPVKVWIDGKQKYTDPAGINPCVPDEANIRLKASKGKHEVIIALGSNHKRAWGIMLRLQRHDVTKKQLKEGPTTYALPTILG